MRFFSYGELEVRKLMISVNRIIANFAWAVVVIDAERYMDWGNVKQV